MAPPDFVLPPFCVYILESSKIEEFGAGFSEAFALRQVLTFSGVRHHFQICPDRRSLEQAVACIPSFCALYQTFPVVHLSGHGSFDGLVLTSGDFVRWPELTLILEPIHKHTNGLYLLSLSSCEGLGSVRQSITANGLVFGFVGTLKPVLWSDNIIGFATLYHLLQKGRSLHEAIAGMRMASGHDDYDFVHGPTFVNAVAEAKKNNTL